MAADAARRSPDTAVSLRAVGKTYRAAPSLRELARGRLRGAAVRALDGVDLELGRGEVLGVMGANGAGKTTLLRLVAGLTTPSEGALLLDGAPVDASAARLRRRVGLMLSDERSFSWRLTARENLAFFAALHGWRRADALARVAALLVEVGIAPVADRAVSTLSTGMRQRLALARALVGAPSVLLLDEPTRGVDPAGRRSLRALARDLAATPLADGSPRTLVIATHDVDEAELLCGRVLVLADGRIRALVPAGEIRAAIRTLLVDDAEAAHG